MFSKKQRPFVTEVSVTRRLVAAACFTLFALLQIQAQKSSIIFLGDLHYDRMEDHDMEWLATKPGDLRQVMEYTAITRDHWNDFMQVINTRIPGDDFPVKAIVQAGDLSEGLAGSGEKAMQMAAGVVQAVEDTHMPVPWIIARGNHDITGPGAKEAFHEHYVPLFRKQTGNPGIQNASYSYSYDDVQIVCLDPWDQQTDMAAFLEESFSQSDATVRFVVVHEPVIPVTERCWYVYKKEVAKREALLEVIAKNKAIVLCGHLHRYSVVSRQTAYGPVVQVMAVSVVRDRDYQVPVEELSVYGPSLVDLYPEWQPESREERKAILENEARHVTFYKQTDLPGYAMFEINPNDRRVVLKYFAAFGDRPYDTMDFTELINP